jgi:hypothetical protein
MELVSTFGVESSEFDRIAKKINIKRKPSVNSEYRLNTEDKKQYRSKKNPCRSKGELYLQQDTIVRKNEVVLQVKIIRKQFLKMLNTKEQEVDL